MSLRRSVLVVILIIGVLLLTLLPFIYVGSGISTPNLGLVYSKLYVRPPTPVPTQHVGLDVELEPQPVWGFWDREITWIEADYARGFFEIWYAGGICLLGLECKFTPLFDLDTGEYRTDPDGYVEIELWRDSVKVFVPTRNIEQFRMWWKPINTLRYEYPFILLPRWAR